MNENLECNHCHEPVEDEIFTCKALRKVVTEEHEGRPRVTEMVPWDGAICCSAKCLHDYLADTWDWDDDDA